jgi:hypothetical protein
LGCGRPWMLLGRGSKRCSTCRRTNTATAGNVDGGDTRRAQIHARGGGDRRRAQIHAREKNM